MKTIRFDKTVLKRFYNNASDDFVDILKDYIRNKSALHLSLKKAYKEGIPSLQQAIYVNAAIFCRVGFPALTAAFLAFETQCKKATEKTELKESFKNILSAIDESVILAEIEMEKLEQQICQ